MLTPWEVDRLCEQRAMAVKAEALTPQHSAAEAAMDSGDDEDQAEELRLRVQHLAEPYPVDAPEVAHADLGKRYDQAVDVPTGYPSPARVDPEAFRRGPITSGEAAYSPAYDV